MKKINLLMVALVGAATLMLTSCDVCKDVTCENGGTCTEGTCDCPEGFTGDACEVEDKCITENVKCENDGTCDDGKCTCTDGYEGETCADGWADKMISDYDVDDNSVSNVYTSEISASSTDGHINIIIKDFGSYLCNGEAVDVNATMTSSSDFTIEEQTYCSGDTQFTIKGTGSINEGGTVITVNYSGDEPGGSSTYSAIATMTKK